MERQALDDLDTSTSVGKRRPVSSSSSAAGGIRKRQRKQDPVEKALDEIEDTVRQHADHSSHRQAHRLKYLIREVQKHSPERDSKEKI